MIWVKAEAPFALLEAVAAALPTPRDGTWTDAHEDRPTEPLALDVSVLSRLLRRFMHYDYVDGRLLAAVLAALAHGGERGEANTGSGGLENMSNEELVDLCESLALVCRSEELVPLPLHSGDPEAVGRPHAAQSLLRLLAPAAHSGLLVFLKRTRVLNEQICRHGHIFSTDPSLTPMHLSGIGLDLADGEGVEGALSPEPACPHEALHRHDPSPSPSESSPSESVSVLQPALDQEESGDCAEERVRARARGVREQGWTGSWSAWPTILGRTATEATGTAVEPAPRVCPHAAADVATNTAPGADTSQAAARVVLPLATDSGRRTATEVYHPYISNTVLPVGSHLPSPREPPPAGGGMVGAGSGEVGRGEVAVIVLQLCSNLTDHLARSQRASLLSPGACVRLIVALAVMGAGGVTMDEGNAALALPGKPTCRSRWLPAIGRRIDDVLPVLPVRAVVDVLWAVVCLVLTANPSNTASTCTTSDVGRVLVAHIAERLLDVDAARPCDEGCIVPSEWQPEMVNASAQGLATAPEGLTLVRTESAVPPLLGAGVVLLDLHDLTDVAVCAAAAFRVWCVGEDEAAGVHEGGFRGAGVTGSETANEACLALVRAVRLCAVLPESLRQLEPVEAEALCWAFARVGTLDAAVREAFRDAMRAREARRSADAILRLDHEGWQLGGGDMYEFDDVPRRPPSWATHETVRRLVVAAISDHFQQGTAGEAGSMCFVCGDAEGQVRLLKKCLPCPEDADGNAEQVLRPLPMRSTDCGEEYHGAARDCEELQRGAMECPDLLIGCVDNRLCECEGRMCVQCLVGWVVECGRRWRRPTCPTCRTPFCLLDLFPLDNWAATQVDALRVGAGG